MKSCGRSQAESTTIPMRIRGSPSRAVVGSET
jgi:hypothetical protein